MTLDSAAGGDVRREHRVGRRRPARAGCAAQVRVGALGLGPDLGAGLIDVSENGACVRVKTALASGAQVELKLAGPGRGKPVTVMGTVCWCRPDGGRFMAGVRLARRLTYSEMGDLAR
jgi:PilZ domain